MNYVQIGNVVITLIKKRMECFEDEGLYSVQVTYEPRRSIPSRSQRSVNLGKPRLPHDIPRAGGAYDFDTATPLPRDQSSKPEVMSSRTKTSSRAIPGEAASLSERRARKSAFSPDAARLTRC